MNIVHALQLSSSGNVFLTQEKYVAFGLLLKDTHEQQKKPSSDANLGNDTLKEQ